MSFCFAPVWDSGINQPVAEIQLKSGKTVTLHIVIGYAKYTTLL